MNPLLQLRALGQRVWPDNLSRTLLREGGLKRLIDDDGLAGVTSNPVIFYKAMSESPYYRDELAALKRDATLSPEECYERLAVSDIQRPATCCDRSTIRPEAKTAMSAWKYRRRWQTIPRERLPRRSACTQW
jgi:transaldolase